MVQGTEFTFFSIPGCHHLIGEREYHLWVLFNDSMANHLATWPWEVLYASGDKCPAFSGPPGVFMNCATAAAFFFVGRICSLGGMRHSGVVTPWV